MPSTIDFSMYFSSVTYVYIQGCCWFFFGGGGQTKGIFPSIYIQAVGHKTH